jgi:hypothetical protein
LPLLDDELLVVEVFDDLVLALAGVLLVLAAVVGVDTVAAAFGAAALCEAGLAVDFRALAADLWRAGVLDAGVEAAGVVAAGVGVTGVAAAAGAEATLTVIFGLRPSWAAR